jgi:O-antigen/teichoic acid export membrane protein
MSTRSLRTNFFFNLLTPIARTAVALVTIPIYIHHLGDARYGVLQIAWILLGYFGFLDLGLSRASINALAKLRAARQSDRARVLLTTLMLSLGFSLVGAVLLYGVGGYMFQHVLSVPADLKQEIAQSFPWMVCLFPMTLVAGVGAGALESRERFLLANALQILTTSLGQIAPVVMAAFVSPSLTVVMPSVAIAQAASLVVTGVCVYRLEGPFSFRSFDWAEARTLLHYGGWVTVTSVIYPILIAADQFLIGTLIGVAEVAHYAVPMNLVTRTQTIPAALGRTFFPRLSSLPRESAHELGARALALLGYAYGAVCAPGILLAPVFIRYWIGPDFAVVSGPGGANPLFRRLAPWTVLCRLHAHSKPGPTGPDGKAALCRVAAVSGRSLASHRELRRQRRGGGMDLAVRRRRVLDVLGGWNFEKGRRIRGRAPGGAALRLRRRLPICRLQRGFGASRRRPGRPDRGRPGLRLFGRLSPHPCQPAHPGPEFRRGSHSPRQAGPIRLARTGSYTTALDRVPNPGA